MKRAEAIKQVREWDFLSKDDKDVLAVLVPELRESEDERIRKDLIGGLMWQRDNLCRLGPHDDNLILPGFCENVGKHLSYLEKQKEQKPVEWSEEDKGRIQRIHDFLMKNRKGDTDTIYQIEKDADWLKSLLSRPIKADNWKPSEEQMAVLLNAEGLVRANNYPENAKILASLYKNLKNLM